MSGKKLTVKEIIKALEYWKKFDNEIDQMLSGRFKDNKMLIEQKEIVKITLNLFDLINRQQAKIEEFMKETAVTTLIDDAVVYTPTIEDFKKFKKKFKSEAVKEFSERIKELIQTKEFTDDVAVLLCAFIDNICKEMVGENNEI